MNSPLLRRIFANRSVFASVVSKRCSTPTVPELTVRISEAIRCSFSTNPIDNEHEHDQEMMAGYLEYLDDMLDKTTDIESRLTELKETYELKRQVLGASAPDELNKLFEKSEAQKEDLTQKLGVLKEMLKSHHASYAVEGPDGMSDESIDEEVYRDLKEAEQIIDYASKHEDTEQIRIQHKKKEMPGQPKYWSDE